MRSNAFFIPTHFFFRKIIFWKLANFEVLLYCFVLPTVKSYHKNNDSSFWKSKITDFEELVFEHHKKNNITKKMTSP